MHSPAEYKDRLETLGYRLKDDGKFWRSKALYRGGKNENSMSICKNSGVWSDYGAGVESKPFKALLEFHGIKDWSNENSVQVESDIVEEIDEPQIERIYPESSLSKLLPHYKFYVEKGITQDSLKRLKSGMATQGKMYERYVFPIFNKYEKIVGFSGRIMVENTKKPKWKHIGKKKNWVYPLYLRDSDGKFFVKEAIEKTKEVILTESIGDTIKLHSSNIYNVLVAFGLKISPAIISELLALNPEKIYISFNNDLKKPYNSGLNAAVNEYLLLLNYFDPCSLIICLPTKNDFGDMNGFDISEWLKKKDNRSCETQKQWIVENTYEIPNIKEEERDIFFSKLENKNKLWVSKKAFKNLSLLR